MLWTLSLCLFVAWLLSLLLWPDAGWTAALPLALAALLLYRLVGTALNR